MSIAPKHWTEFQHYKDRSPAWIKLHRRLLDDFTFHRLPIASRALAPMLWLLASEYDSGKITATIEELAFRLHTTDDDLVAALKPLIESGFFVSDSEVLAPCKHDAIPEKKEEKEKQEREEIDSRTVAKATRPERDEKFEEFKKAYPKRKGANPWKPARAQWDVALKTGATADLIILAVKSGCGFDRDKIGTEYIPQAVKWLRDRRFDDWVSVAADFVPVGFYAADMSAELAAWDAHSQATKGTYLPRDKNGGWYVPTQWPPGYAPPNQQDDQQARH